MSETMPLSLSAIRMRRLRHRRKEGLTCIPLTLTAAEVAALVRRGLLPADATADKAAVQRAMHAWLDSGVLAR